MGTNIWESYPAAVYEGSPWVKHYYQAMDQGIGSVFEAYYPEPINGWFRISVRPAKTGIIFFAQDITEQRLALDALIQSEKLAAVGRLASSIAHEINNPLEAVTNLLYLARSLARESELEAYLDKAEQQLRRVAMITNQTLRFHKQATRPQEMDCAELFSTVLSIYEGRLKNAHIMFETRTRAHKPVICFEGEIRQVLANFVGNAIDAMPHGGRLLIRGREATDWRSGRAGLVLTVGDDGGGIDARTLARMFDAFFYPPRAWPEPDWDCGSAQKSWPVTMDASWCAAASARAGAALSSRSFCPSQPRRVLTTWGRRWVLVVLKPVQLLLGKRHHRQPELAEQGRVGEHARCAHRGQRFRLLEALVELDAHQGILRVAGVRGDDPGRADRLFPLVRVIDDDRFPPSSCCADRHAPARCGCRPTPFLRLSPGHRRSTCRARS